MAVPQQKFRELVFQLLYGEDVGRSEKEDMLHLMSAELAVSKKVVKDAQERVDMLLARRVEIDAMIKKVSRSYDFHRIQLIERNILRLGVFELFFDETIPPKVAMSESMRLARKFSTPESTSFINAILDHLYKLSLGVPASEMKLAEAIEAKVESEKIAEQAALTRASEDEEGIRQSL